MMTLKKVSFPGCSNHGEKGLLSFKMKLINELNKLNYFNMENRIKEVLSFFWRGGYHLSEEKSIVKAISGLLAEQRERSAKIAGEEFAKFAKSQCVNEEACYYVIHLKDSIRGALLP